MHFVRVGPVAQDRGPGELDVRAGEGHFVRRLEACRRLVPVVEHRVGQAHQSGVVRVVAGDVARHFGARVEPDQGGSAWAAPAGWYRTTLLSGIHDRDDRVAPSDPDACRGPFRI